MGLFDKIKQAKDIFGDVNEMKKAQNRIQKELSSRSITGKSGDGLVNIEITLSYDIVDVQIAASEGFDNTAIQKGIIEAFRDAKKKIESESIKVMSSIVAEDNQ